VDAIPPASLRDLVSDCITQHIDYEELERTKRVEELEKKTLEDMSKTWRPKKA
jgi:hypothetical protein